MSASDHLSAAQFVYASPQRQAEIRSALEPILPHSRSAKTTARGEGVIRAVTFSGIPAEHLQGLTGISYQRQNTAHASYHRTVMRHTGRVVEASVRMDLPTADAVGTDKEARRHLIHEIGHHVHAQTDPQDYRTSSYYDVGKVEAVAENYADRNARSNTSSYDEIANATPEGDRAAWDTLNSWGRHNRSSYLKHRQAGTQPDGS